MKKAVKRMKINKQFFQLLFLVITFITVISTSYIVKAENQDSLKKSNLKVPKHYIKPCIYLSWYGIPVSCTEIG